MFSSQCNWSLTGKNVNNCVQILVMKLKWCSRLTHRTKSNYYYGVYINLTIFYFVQIYIPIGENMDHWYLMVIDLPGKKIFHLDCDLTSQTAYDRKDTIKIMVCLYCFNLLIIKLMTFSYVHWLTITIYICVCVCVCVCINRPSWCWVFWKVCLKHKI